MRIRVTFGGARADVHGYACVRWPHRVDGTNAAPATRPSPHLVGDTFGDVFSFSIDVERDPQSDDFHGIWDDMGGGTYLNILGNGSGTVDDGEITGLLKGVFAFYEPVRNPNIVRTGLYCTAVDHRFRLVKEP
jgi:hypothetical protein